MRGQPFLSACFVFLALSLSACSAITHKPAETGPYPHQGTLHGGLMGASTGAMGGTALITFPVGVALGTAIGLTTGSYYNSPQGVISDLQKRHIQVVQLGDTTTVYLPSARLFEDDGKTLKPAIYPVLTDVAKLAIRYKTNPINVDAYTDNVLVKADNDKISTTQAQQVASFLWVRGVHHSIVQHHGYGSENPIATNHTNVGSLANRRVVIRLKQMV